MRTLPVCPKPSLILSFDFDGTLHDPAESPPVPLSFFDEIRRLRESHYAVWGINTGRSMPQLTEGFMESSFPFLPDWAIVREREIYFPNSLGRFLPHTAWNQRCEKDIEKLFKKSRKVLAKIRSEVEEHTGAQYIEMKGEPAGLISRTEEEMEWIIQRISPWAAEISNLGWQRNSIYLRFGHKNYQKGTALSELASLCGLDATHIFAAGDSHNDLEMLSEAHSGYAACPKNAVLAVKDLISARAGFQAEAASGYGIIQALRHFFP